jgi:hypothetical protein
MTTITLNVSARAQEQARRIRMAIGDANLNDSEVELATKMAGHKIHRNRVKQLKEATKEPYPTEVAVLARVCGVDEAFLRGERYVFPDFRDLDEAIPGYDNPATLRDRISRRILKNDHSQRFHCFDCLLDPDFHVLAEWLEPAGVLPQVPGQTEFIINIEKMLEEVA